MLENIEKVLNKQHPQVISIVTPPTLTTSSTFYFLTLKEKIIIIVNGIKSMMSQIRLNKSDLTPQSVWFIRNCLTNFVKNWYLWVFKLLIIYIKYNRCNSKFEGTYNKEKNNKFDFLVNICNQVLLRIQTNHMCCNL